MKKSIKKNDRFLGFLEGFLGFFGRIFCKDFLLNFT